MMRVKLYITLYVDPEDYPVPADGNVDIEIEEAIREYLYEIEGINVKSIKTLQEN